MKKSRWRLKRKRWLDRHSRVKKETKRRQCLSINRSAVTDERNYVIKTQLEKTPPYVLVTPPKIFSLTKNTEDTMRFFMYFAKELERKEQGKTFFVDSSKVEQVTADALIYLIAILENEQLNKKMRYIFTGNYPDNGEAKKVYAESGFNDYVESKMRKLPKSTDKMCIISGTRNQSKTARDLCDFLIRTLGKNRVQIQPMQRILIELMSNVYYHAYEKNSFMAKKWYLYAEHIGEKVNCIFVDTGKGIARTVRKNFKEKIERLFGVGTKDSELIESAFRGEFRTQTGEGHRGNGLSSVKKNAKNALFEGFEVVSGHGRCAYPNDQDAVSREATNYPAMLYGTLYTFTLR